MRTERRGTAVAGGFSTAGILLLAIAGCSLVGRSRAPETIGPPITFFQPDTAEVAGPPDSLSGAARPAPAIPVPPPREEPRRARRPSPPPEASVAPDTLAAPADSTPEQSPISIDLPDEKKAELWRTTLRDLAAASSLLERVPATPRSDEEAVKVQTLRGLIAQARSALDRRDFQAAASLAHKARLLAGQLATR